ncbi:hypothetical protein HMPREF3213_00217 [Heyndrickxia coagulans]|uniref:Uncharacterized protein n=1 Tax=Heyndrickxia coagulans TaxID=1398 RepID=A0A133L2Y5_HEYCO|nr:hypothetical protein HMPREF3213_00217 [Heyndrickxia coagulans]
MKGVLLGKNSGITPLFFVFKFCRIIMLSPQGLMVSNLHHSQNVSAL